MKEGTITEGQILTGVMFNEPMRVVTARASGAGAVIAGLVGQTSGQFREVTLTAEDIAQLNAIDPNASYDGDGELLKLALQAYTLGIAHEFDPYFGLSISRVDPLPHQLEAVYEYFMKLPSVRFLLADDAGAGKTIMAGLLIRELKLRGLVERMLIVCPANLTFQWQREMLEKFDQQFVVMRGSDIHNQFGMNQWLERPQVITSLDLAKRQDILPGLEQVHWDLVIIDEAHRMSASDESHKSLRYRLGEKLRDSTDNILLMTATPHKGDPQNFTLFLQLLDQDAYADVTSIRRAMEQNQAPFYLRRVKEAMVHFPELQDDGTWAAKPVFTERIPRTADFTIEGDELDLYNEVTDFVKRQSMRAYQVGDDRRARAVGFLMALYQRRLASSTHAMVRSLENRVRRLDTGLQQAQDLASHAPPDLPDPEDLEVGRAMEDMGNQVQGAEGRLVQAQNRHGVALERRERRRRELEQQQALTLQGVERLATVLVTPHPDRDDPDVRNLKSSRETELTAMQVVMEHELAQGRQVEDVSERDLGYDVKSLDLKTGDLRLIEVKGLAAETGTILLSPNEHRVAEDRPDCFWLYVVTNCAGEPQLREPIPDPARFEWHEVSKIQHYWLQVDAITQPKKVQEERASYSVDTKTSSQSNLI